MSGRESTTTVVGSSFLTQNNQPARAERMQHDTQQTTSKPTMMNATINIPDGQRVGLLGSGCVGGSRGSFGKVGMNTRSWLQRRAASPVNNKTINELAKNEIDATIKKPPSNNQQTYPCSGRAMLIERGMEVEGSSTPSVAHEGHLLPAIVVVGGGVMFSFSDVVVVAAAAARRVVCRVFIMVFLTVVLFNFIIRGKVTSERRIQIR